LSGRSDHWLRITCPTETDCVKYQCVEGDCQSSYKDGSCDDDDACTSGDECSAGMCHGQPVEVPEDTQCETFSCDASDGVKSKTKVGESCNDGDECTGQDICRADGGCRGQPITGCREAKICEEQMPGSTSNPNCNGECSADLCESHPIYGHPTDPGGISGYCYKCKEEEPCDCPGNTDCVSYDCVNGECVSEYKTGSCDDGDECTTGDECSAGMCHGQAVDVDDGNECTDDSCVDGEVKHENNTDSCDDGDVCTGRDKCNQGTCTGQPITGCYETCAEAGLGDGGCPSVVCDRRQEACSPVDPRPGLKCHSCYPSITICPDNTDCVVYTLVEGECIKDTPPGSCDISLPHHKCHLYTYPHHHNLNRQHSPFPHTLL